MRVVAALETKFEAQLERTRQSAGDDGPEIDRSLHVAQNLHAVIKPGISLSLCRQLYCMVSSATQHLSAQHMQNNTANLCHFRSSQSTASRYALQS